MSRFDGKEVINLASNNYLGLTTHPKLIEAAIDAARQIGGADRARCGPSPARWICIWNWSGASRSSRTWKPAWCFSLDFAANAGTVSAVLTPEDHIISDELNHASIIDGCRLSRAKIHVFPHKDHDGRGAHPGRTEGASGRKLLITDGVFSMDGDIGAAARTGGGLRNGTARS